MAEWQIVLYESAAGRSPVQEYLDGLRTNEAARIAVELRLLRTSGTDLGPPHVRRLVGTELWELRIRGGIQHRVFYIGISGRRLLLLHAFQKKTQKTPEREINTALNRLADYRQRHGS